MASLLGTYGLQTLSWGNTLKSDLIKKQNLDWSIVSGNKVSDWAVLGNIWVCESNTEENDEAIEYFVSQCEYIPSQKPI